MQTISLAYNRRPTGRVKVGETYLGSEFPVRIQTMANTDTNNINDSVRQAVTVAEAGAELLRFTTQGVHEVESLQTIHRQLREQNINIPLVADVHFNANVADSAACVVEKVRINPGNYVDPARQFKHIDYTDAEYYEELRRLRERFLVLLGICKQHHTALRIGVNHGSLSDRIMSRYGDTPAGMVESCMEFLRICTEEHFEDVVISIKASSTRVMVQTVELLVRTMDSEDLHFPLHLGVTEAGEGEDGRIKSAVGIGALLSEGIGDTVRVSLSEAPEKELPVARELVRYMTAPDSPRYTRLQVYKDGDTVVYNSTDDCDWDTFALHLAADFYSITGWTTCPYQITYKGECNSPRIERLMKDIWQAAGLIRYKTEYVSCPSCGRTLFDLETVIRDIKAATSHLQGLKIAIMGCIVNGPGEMADADYGYVGAARGKVSLYKGKQCVMKNIPQEEAVQCLLELVEKG